MNTKILSNNVKKYREHYLWSVRELSRRSGLSPAVISLIENQKKDSFSKDTLERIAGTFRITVNELFDVECGEFEVTDFMDAIEIILNSDDIKVGTSILTKDEKNELIFGCEALCQAIIKKRKIKQY